MKNNNIKIQVRKLGLVSAIETDGEKIFFFYDKTEREIVCFVVDNTGIENLIKNVKQRSERDANLKNNRKKD